MKFFTLVIFTAMMMVPIWAGNSFAAIQNVGGVTEALDAATGQVDGVSFTGPGTVTVTDGQPLNSNNLATGVATSVDNQGSLVFAGSSIVSGAIGTAPLSLNTITASGAAGKTVSFLGNVFADTNAILNGTGTISFGGNYTGTVNYNTGATGTITLADAKTMTGAINNSTGGQGTLTLGTGSSVVGTVGNTGIGLALINLSGASSSITGATGATTINLSGASSSITGATRATTINMTAASTAITGAVTATNVNLTGGNAAITGATTVTNFDLNGNTLAIVGALTVPGNGSLALDASSGTSFGRITDVGTATITPGATVAVTVTGFVPDGATMVIVDGTTGTAVAPGLLVSSSSPNVTFTANNAGAAQDLTLTATRTTGGTIIDVIDDLPAPPADILTVLDAIDVLPTAAAVSNAVAQLDPTNNGATTQAVVNTVNAAMGAITTHLGEAGDNSTFGRSGVSTGDFWKDNGFWVKSFGDSAEQETRKGANGYDSSMWGAIGGVDGIITHDVLLGIAGGYAATNVDNKGENGGTDIDSYIGTVYVSYDAPSPWYGDMGFTFTWNSYNSSRHIVFPGVDRMADSNPDGQTYTGFWDLGYVVPMNAQWNLTPIAGLTYSHSSIGKYTETGAGDLNLIVKRQDYDQLLSSLGVRIDARANSMFGKWVPEAHFRWLYDFVGDPVATTSTFTGGGSTFDTRGLEPEQSTYNFGTGCTFYSKGNVSITGVYDYKFGTDFESHTGLGTIRWTF